MATKCRQNGTSPQKSNSESRPKLEELFRTCDTKGDGVIGPQEFCDLCDKFGISGPDSAVIFADLDHDGDGQIDFDDFSFGFRDFLTPGSRRGSLQIPLVTNEGVNNFQAYHQQLEEMEKKHKSARQAWKQFTNNVGITNVQPIQPLVAQSGQQLYEIVEEIRSENGTEVSTKLEKALTHLISDVQTLHEEYKTLETTFKKEREVHAAQLTALGEELDHQLAKTEAKAKAEAREEAQKQMDSERKKIATEMESQLSDLSAQLRTFHKVEEWLSEEEAKKFRSPEEAVKLVEAESENRNLKSALVEAQMKATLLQTQLAQKRNEYVDLYHQLHSEKVAATEYRNQVDLMQNHLSILSQANRVLSDANDCFSMGGMQSPTAGHNINDGGSGGSQPNSLPCDLMGTSPQIHRVHSDNLIKYETIDLSPPRNYQSTDTDRDSGQGTLLEELRAEGDGSPLPSGVWSSSHSPSPQESPTNSSKLSKASSKRSPCCLGSPTDEPKISSSKKNARKSNKKGEEVKNTYKSFNTYDPDDPSLLLGSEGGQRSPPEAYVQPHRTFKVILAGDAAVGKTTFIERVCHGHFTPNLSSTIGVDFRVKSVELEGQAVALQLWDTAGQERFRSLTKSYFRRADGVILMYDVTNERTFLSIRHWIQNVEEGAGRKVPIVLCGNKSDLRDTYGVKGSSCVSAEDGAKLGAHCGAIFIETSPKTGENVLESLVLLAREMSLVEDMELRNSLKLNVDDLGDSSKKRGCCGGSTNSNNSSNPNN